MTILLLSPSTLKGPSLLSFYFEFCHLFPSLLAEDERRFSSRSRYPSKEPSLAFSFSHFVQEGRWFSSLSIFKETVVDPIIAFFFENTSQAEQRAKAKIAPRSFETVKPTACDSLSFIWTSLFILDSWRFMRVCKVDTNLGGRHRNKESTESEAKDQRADPRTHYLTQDNSSKKNGLSGKKEE
jgi:hypothetical protein